MRYLFRFSTDPDKDPEVLKMVIKADNRSDLLYNILNSRWDTEHLYFKDEEINKIFRDIFGGLWENFDKKKYAEDRYDFLMRCQFKLDLRRFLGENNDGSLKRVLHLFGQAVCYNLYIKSGGLDYEYEFLER
jgi:hypothetical protein